MKESDSNKSGDVSLNEFIEYIREHEKNLQLQFSNLDKNKDGKSIKKKHEEKKNSTNEFYLF